MLLKQADRQLGLAKNKRLKAMGAALMEAAEALFSETGKKQRLFIAFSYAAGTWDRERRVIIKAEHSSRGSNPRFIVTSLDGDPQDLYDHGYCARSDMETRIKEQRLLCALVDRRQQLNEMRTAETSRLETAADPSFLAMVKKHLNWIEKELKMLEKKIAETISTNAPMKEKNRRIQRIKGLGKICAATLLAHIPEIGTLSCQEIAALAGLAPYNRDSGATSMGVASDFEPASIWQRAVQSSTTPQ
ncbi:MAG: transposase [Pontiellaceae bacterium]|nr:transposase [Pontiellaceae bacterium]